MSFVELKIGEAGIEIFLFIFACAVMLASLFLPRGYRYSLCWVIVASLIIAALASFSHLSAEPVLAINGFFINSPLVFLLKGIILLAVAMCLALSFNALRVQKMLNGDFLALALLSTLGMLVMMSAAHFLTLYLGLELMSLCLYAMIALRRNNAAASEAAIKYFVLGALASGLFLYGVSMIYGATGKLSIAEVAQIANTIGDGNQRLILVLGLVFVLSGVAFKLGVAPFHMWLPDVYHASSAPMTLFIATAPKITAFAMLTRILVEALPILQSDWKQMLMILAVLSLAIGNITAIAQTNLKRMLAYSAIAHSGFLVLGLLVGDLQGISASMFYITIYALMSIGAFGVIILLSENSDEERSNFSDIQGLSAKNLPIAFVFSILMLSLAGIPPMVGFIAKFVILEALINAGYVGLAIFAVLLSLVGAFYYLRVIRLIFFSEPVKEGGRIELNLSSQVLLIIVSVLVLWYGIFPDSLLSLFESVVKRSLL